MSRPSEPFDYMDLDDFEEALADKPRDEKSSLDLGTLDVAIPLAEIYQDVLAA